MQAMQQPGYAALRRHRWSTSGAECFVTIKAERPSTALATRQFVAAAREMELRLEREGVWSVRCATMMPDHLHLLFVLGETDDLAGCIRKFKGRLSPVLRGLGARWQEGLLRAPDARR